MTFPSKEDITLSAWATAYAENGWPVFPLVPNNKQPLTKRGFQDASDNLDQISEWWTVWPEANIGLPTGIKFDVLDVDGPDAALALSTHLQSKGIQYIHQGPVSCTGKGWHYLFVPTGRGNGAKLLEGAAIDFRGIGGYIVAPPSRHPNGHRYLWQDSRGPDSPIVAQPDWLIPMLTREARGRREHIQWDPTKTATANWAMQAAGQALVDQLPRAIRQRANRPDILAVWEARYGHPVKDRGHYMVTTCPFHEDSTPSFTLYQDNTFHCYGCGAHGDSFDLDKDEPTHI